jgi:autophagy-related protein 101
MNERIGQTVDRETAREALRGLLHAILFHRLFGIVAPTTLDVLDTALPAVRDAGTEREVEGKVDAFLRALLAVQRASRLGRVELAFCERRVTRGGWFSTGEVRRGDLF